MPKGTVKWFNPTKGYGFIQPQGGGGRDVFVHISAVERAGLGSLNEGQVVEYEEVSNRGKTSATSRFSADFVLGPASRSPRLRYVGVFRVLPTALGPLA
jgi:CspA family cold shock protein